MPFINGIDSLKSVLVYTLSRHLALGLLKISDKLYASAELTDFFASKCEESVTLFLPAFLAM